MTMQRAILPVTAIAATLAISAPAGATTLLSGYGGPGQGSQAILGATLLPGPGEGSGGGGTGAAATASGSLPAGQQGAAGASGQAGGTASSRHAARHHAGATVRPDGTGKTLGGTAAALPRGYLAASAATPALGISGEDLMIAILCLAAVALTAALTWRFAGRSRDG
jgi:hypothetical protein